jgi:hypothetical protein
LLWDEPVPVPRRGGDGAADGGGVVAVRRSGSAARAARDGLMCELHRTTALILSTFVLSPHLSVVGALVPTRTVSSFRRTTFRKALPETTLLDSDIEPRFKRYSQ